MKRYTFCVEATSVAGSQTYYVDAESEDEAREVVEGGGGEFVCEELEVQDLGKFELVDVEDVPVEQPDAAPRRPNTIPSTQAVGEPWQVGDDTSSVQISRDGSTHKWGCKCDGCAPPPGSAPLTEEERDGILDWVSACQSAYHIDNTPGHRFGGLGSNLGENHEGLIEFVESIVADRSALLAASMGGDKS